MARLFFEMTYWCCIAFLTFNGSWWSLPVNAQQRWGVNEQGGLLLDNQPVRLKGFALTCTEYLLRGIGVNCIASYNWNDPSNIITGLNRQELDAIYNFLLPAPSGVVPTVRICLTAAYWLDVESSRWSTNRRSYPNLAAQYRTLISKFVADATAKGIVVILDLHWNNDVDEQKPMAQKGISVGDSLTFWTQLAQQFKANPLVFYELYNEPHANTFAEWFDGSAQYEGMKVLANAVANEGVTGMILVAGAYSYAYDAASLVQFSNSMPATVMQKVAFVVHPYMGPYQAGDTKKNIIGFGKLMDDLSVAKRPVVVTELGQYCCAANGACYAYDGTYNGVSMGYVQAVFKILAERNQHWQVWGWRPNSGSGNCNQPDANEGQALYDASLHSGQGADYKTLFPMFYPNGISPPVTARPSVAVGTSTSKPSSPPSTATTSAPTRNPVTAVPTVASTVPLTAAPTRNPVTAVPTVASGVPLTAAPTQKPATARPTRKPTTVRPSKKPTSARPTKAPTTAPSNSAGSTVAPTRAPTTLTTLGGTCVNVWAQCAGSGFQSVSCCSGLVCVFQNTYYSQCQQGTGSVPTGTLSPTAPCVATYGQCGGIGFSGPSNCCAGASSCVSQNPYYSQCVPAGGRRLR